MRILNWNIKWGGQDRVRRISHAIRERKPDVVFLTEYQPRGSAPLLGELAAAGWVYQVLSSPPPRRGGVAIVSRMPVISKAPPTDLTPFAARYVGVTVPDAGIDVRGVYGLLEKEPYNEFWSALLNSLERDAKDSVIVVGDFNTGESELDAPRPNFYCSEYFCALPKRGFTDLWRHKRGREAREYTWNGRKNPYRLDHAFGTASVVARLQSCDYSHKERDSGISDHALMLVELAD
jgi:exonuclease III